MRKDNLQIKENLYSGKWRKAFLKGDCGFIDEEIQAKKMEEILVFEKRLKLWAIVVGVLVVLLLIGSVMLMKK